jgi:tetratricopeptide (TPR) repeat protein
VLVLRWRGELDASNVSRLYTALAGAYATQGDGQKAIDACLRGLSLIDRNQQRDYYHNLRQALLDIIGKQVPGGPDAVVAHYEKTMTAEGEMPQMRIVFGEAYREAGQEQKALSQFSIAADLLPKDTVLRKEVIDGYRRLGQQDKAEQAYLSWAKLDPQNIEVYRGLGQLYEELGRQQDAMAAYATMAEVRPREAEGHRAYGQVLVAKKYDREAVVHYLKAVQYRPTEFDIASELAGVYETLGRTDDIRAVWTNGEAACHRSMEDLPDDPLPWLNLARFLKAQGRKDEARELCQRILVRPWPRFVHETQVEAGAILGSLN